MLAVAVALVGLVAPTPANAQDSVACCLPDGSCVDLDSQFCADIGGRVRGPRCELIRCPYPLADLEWRGPDNTPIPEDGLTVFEGQVFTVELYVKTTSEEESRGISGIDLLFQWDPQYMNFHCFGTYCEAREACCLPNDTCENQQPTACLDDGGVPQGSGLRVVSTATCDTIGNCPVTSLGACCMPDGSCRSAIAPAQCVDDGGIPQGPSSNCSNALCFGPNDIKFDPVQCSPWPVDRPEGYPNGWLYNCPSARLSGFGNDTQADCLNCPINDGLPPHDGDALWQVFSQLSDPATATPEGLLVQVFYLRAKAITPVGEPAQTVHPLALGQFSKTRVFASDQANLDLLAGQPLGFKVNIIPAPACCLPEGGCDEMPPEECEARDGVSFPDTPCSQVTCPQTGACCLPSGECLDDTFQDVCEGMSGDYQGDDQDCATLDPPCPVKEQACCFADGTCQNIDLSTDECENQLGTPREGHRCEEGEDLCKGACCSPDGTCELLAENACTGDGVFLGIGMECGDCPEACCFDDGSCQDLTTEECEAANGVPRGPRNVLADHPTV